jgi:hypothetical protein
MRQIQRSFQLFKLYTFPHQVVQIQPRERRISLMKKLPEIETTTKLKKVNNEKINVHKNA